MPRLRLKQTRLTPEQIEQKASVAGLLGGTVNTVLALPFGGAAKAVRSVFGGVEQATIAQGLTAAFEQEGAKGILGALEKLRAAGLSDEALQSVNEVRKQITKSLGQRALDVAKTAGRDAAIGGANQVGQNIIAQNTYDPDRKTLEGVPEQALAFGALGGLSETARQAVNAKRVFEAGQIARTPVEHPPLLPPRSAGVKPPLVVTTTSRPMPARRRPSARGTPSSGRRASGTRSRMRTTSPVSRACGPRRTATTCCGASARGN